MPQQKRPPLVEERALEEAQLWRSFSHYVRYIKDGFSPDTVRFFLYRLYTTYVEKIPIPDAAREYLGRIGSIKTERKTATSRANISKAQAARRRDPLTRVCLCDGGDSLKFCDHKTTCPRGRLLYQREWAAQKRGANL